MFWKEDLWKPNQECTEGYSRWNVGKIGLKELKPMKVKTETKPGVRKVTMGIILQDHTLDAKI